MGDIFYIYFNFYVGHYYWWLQHLIFPSCSATFISITINHISLLENMKGCNLNFPKRFSRKKNKPRHYITISIPRYRLVNWWISSIHQDQTARATARTNIARRDCENCQPRHGEMIVSSEAPGLMFSTLLHPLWNLLVVTVDLPRPCQSPMSIFLGLGIWDSRRT